MLQSLRVSQLVTHVRTHTALTGHKAVQPCIRLSLHQARRVKQELVHLEPRCYCYATLVTPLASCVPKKKQQGMLHLATLEEWSLGNFSENPFNPLRTDLFHDGTAIQQASLHSNMSTQHLQIGESGCLFLTSHCILSSVMGSSILKEDCSIQPNHAREQRWVTAWDSRGFLCKGPQPPPPPPPPPPQPLPWAWAPSQFRSHAGGSRSTS